jgi:hypothetical protein
MNDSIAQMMIGYGLKDKIIDWPDDSGLNATGFKMITYNSKTGVTEATILGNNYVVAKREFSELTSNGTVHGVLFEGRNWR